MEKKFLIKGIILSTIISGSGLLTFSLINNKQTIGELFDDAIKQVSLGEDHSAAVITYADDDYLFTWGSNDFGQLGIGNQTSSDIPQQIFLEQSIIKDVSLGKDFSAVITTDDEGDHLYTWGNNEYGQLGNNGLTSYSKNPFEVKFDEEIIEQVSLGGEHASVITNDGTEDHLYTWGNNNFGQLGLGNTIVSQNIPQEVNFDVEYDDIKQVSLGYDFSAAVLTYGNEDHLYTWGNNNSGQLGLGNKNNFAEPQEVELNDSIIKDISLGKNFSAVITNNGNEDHLYTWGNNTYGQLGLGKTANNILTPQIVPFKEKIIKDVELGFDHSSAITSESDKNNIYTWGNNTEGDLGLGDSGKRNKPTKLNAVPFDEIKQVSLGSDFSAGIANNILYTVGSNSAGQLGETGGSSNIPSPVIFPISSAKTPKNLTAKVDVAGKFSENAGTSTLNYSMDVPSGDPTFINTIIKKIEVVDRQGNSYGVLEQNNGSSNPIPTPIPSQGTIILTNLMPNHTYASGDLQMKVTWNGRFSQTRTKDIAQFTTLPISPALAPSFNSQTTFTNNNDIITVNYDIIVPTESSLVQQKTTIDKIQVVDSQGNIYGSTSDNADGNPISSGTGSFELTNLKPGSSYNDLYIEIIYNSTQVFNSDGSEPFGKIDQITLGQLEALEPSFKDTTTYTKTGAGAEEKFSVNYSLNIPTGDPTTKDTIVSEIKVVNTAGDPFGSISPLEGETIPEQGSFIIENLLPGTNYSDLYLEATYNDAHIFNEGGLDSNGKIPEFTTGLAIASPPSFEKATEYELTTNGYSVVHYYLTVPFGEETTEKTVINKIEVVDRQGNSYGDLDASRGDIILHDGLIILDNLLPGLTYDNLYLKVTYNDGRIFNGDGLHQNGKVPEFHIPSTSISTPEFESQTTIESIEGIYTVKYDLKPSDVVINEIRVISEIDGKIFGSINDDKDIIPEDGAIELNSIENPLQPGTTYSDLYIEIFYNDGKEFNLDNSQILGQVPSFTVNKESALPPSFSFQTTIKEEDGIYKVKYHISIPNNSLAEPTIINEIKVVDNNQKIYGSINNDEGTITENGTIELDNTTIQAGETYNYLYVEILYNDTQHFNLDNSEELGKVPSFTVNQYPAAPPSFANPTTSQKEVDGTYTVGYYISLPEEISSTEPTIINEIRVVGDVTDDNEGTKFIYGSIKDDSGVIDKNGKITLEHIQPGITYSNLYIEVLYNDTQIFNLDNSEKLGKVPSFTADKEPAIIPSFASRVQLKEIDGLYNVSYELNISQESPYNETTIINEIRVVDSNGLIYGSIIKGDDIVPSSSTIKLDNAENTIQPGVAYNDLYVEVLYNDGETFNLEGNEELGKVEDFTVPTNPPTPPIFENPVRLGVSNRSYIVKYSVSMQSIPGNDSTIINEINVVDSSDIIYGSAITNDQGEIDNEGSILLQDLKPGKQYDLHLEIKYNEIGIVNDDGTNPNGKIPIFTVLDQPSEPEILSVSATDITSNSATVEYELNILSGINGVEDTIVTKVEVKDSQGNIYGSIQDSNGLESMGQIVITLQPGQDYSDLFIVITSNSLNGVTNADGLDPNGKIEQFTTLPETNKPCIWPYILLAIILLIFIGAFLAIYLKKRKKKDN